VAWKARKKEFPHALHVGMNCSISRKKWKGRADGRNLPGFAISEGEKKGRGSDSVRSGKQELTLPFGQKKGEGKARVMCQLQLVLGGGGWVCFFRGDRVFRPAKKKKKGGGGGERSLSCQDGHHLGSKRAGGEARGTTAFRLRGEKYLTKTIWFRALRKERNKGESRCARAVEYVGGGNKKDMILLCRERKKYLLVSDLAWISGKKREDKDKDMSCKTRIIQGRG